MNKKDDYQAVFNNGKHFSPSEIDGTDDAGFSAANDYVAEKGIDLIERLIRNKQATFLFRMISSFI